MTQFSNEEEKKAYIEKKQDSFMSKSVREASSVSTLYMLLCASRSKIKGKIGYAETQLRSGNGICISINDRTRMIKRNDLMKEQKEAENELKRIEKQLDDLERSI